MVRNVRSDQASSSITRLTPSSLLMETVVADDVKMTRFSVALVLAHDLSMFKIPLMAGLINCSCNRKRKMLNHKKNSYNF